jgi:hypothetical protein
MKESYDFSKAERGPPLEVSKRLMKKSRENMTISEEEKKKNLERRLRSDDNKYPYDTIVDFTIGSFKGTGKIKGVALNEQAFLGASYIIEVLESNNPIPNETYPYTTIMVPEIYIES